MTDNHGEKRTAGINALNRVSWWSRVLTICGPFSAGILFITGLEHAVDADIASAATNLGVSTTMMLLAWKWSGPAETGAWVPAGRT